MALASNTYMIIFQNTQYLIRSLFPTQKSSIIFWKPEIMSVSSTEVLTGNNRQHKDRWIAYLIQCIKMAFLCCELNKQMSLRTNNNNLLLQALAQNSKVAWLISLKLNLKK